MAKIISLNIEGDKHLDQVLDYLEQESADFLCLQEVFAVHKDLFAKRLGYTHQLFSAQGRVLQENNFGVNPLGDWGLLLLSKTPFLSQQAFCYQGDPESVPEFLSGQPNSVRRVLQVVNTSIDDRSYTIGNIHFTWSPGGSSTPEQAESAQKVLTFLKQFDSLVLAGDFNAPRGGDTRELFANSYSDNIPSLVKSTLDPVMHRSGRELVVDGIFTSPDILVENVKVTAGISDHRAVTAVLYSS